MAIYAGETVQIKVTGTDFNADIPLEESDISNIYVTIFDSTNTEALPQTSMTWDEDEEGWVYLWDTTGLTFGSYKAKIEAYGQAATPQTYALEFARIRLARRIAGV
jgi:hypothetical protein